MKKPKITIINSQNNEMIEREMNDDEFAQWKLDVDEEKIYKAEAEAKALAKSDLLAKLGITEDEAKLLLS